MNKLQSLPIPSSMTAPGISARGTAQQTKCFFKQKGSVSQMHNAIIMSNGVAISECAVNSQ